MSLAVCLIRDQPHYRRQAFLDGLHRAGYELHSSIEGLRPTRTDLLVIWNRYGQYAELADRWERRGGSVIVAENGYIGRDENGLQYYALAIHGHNGSGKWPGGDSRRYDRLGLDLKPWRTQGSDVIVRGQRGIGAPGMASPPNWHHELASAGPKRHAHYGWRWVVQEHPGKPANDPVIAQQLIDSLRSAHAMCIWSSSAGVRALVEGVPVFYAAPHWICEIAAVHGTDDLTQPMMNDAARVYALQRLSWAQWTIDEIESGEPFFRLRGVIEKDD